MDFLDRETAKIDALVDEQKRLIELLKEKRQAVISHAVTKGLNPNAPMKDSSVEWLGQVPEHWEVTRLGRLFREINEAGNELSPSSACQFIMVSLTESWLMMNLKEKSLAARTDRNIRK